MMSSVVTNNVAHVPLMERTRSERQVLLIQYGSAAFVVIAYMTKKEAVRPRRCNITVQ